MSPLTCENVLEEIDLFAAGECDPATCAAIERHVAGCPSCAAALDQAGQVVGWVTLSVREPQSLDRLHARTQAEDRRQRRSRGLLALRTATLAAVLLLTVGLYLRFSHLRDAGHLDDGPDRVVALAKIGPGSKAVYRVENPHEMEVKTGEVLIRFAPDGADARPFKVHTTAGTATAERAEFVVDVLSGRPVSVRVFSGKVTLANSRGQVEARRGETVEVMSDLDVPRRLVENQAFQIARRYVLVEVKRQPRVPALPLPVKPSEVWNWPALAKNAGTLETEGCAVLANAAGSDLVSSYGALQEQGMPVLVTSDTVLHLVRAQMGNLLQDLEEHQLAFDLVRLTAGLRARLTDPKAASDSAPWQEARKLALLYLAIPERLQHPEAETPEGVDGTELAAIVHAVETGQRLQKVPGLDYSADFADFRPVGHYAASAALQRYFRAMMWFGRMPLLHQSGNITGIGRSGDTVWFDGEVSAEQARRQTMAASLITITLGQTMLADGRAAMDVWQRINAATSFFAGTSGQPGPAQYLAAMQSWRGREAFQKLDLPDDGGWYAFRRELMRYVPPPFFADEIFRFVYFTQRPADFNPGFHLLSQRFAVDAFALGKLTAPNVGPGTNSKAFTALMRANGTIVRGVPRGLDLMALLGSAHARRLLHDDGDDAYTGSVRALSYDAAFERLRANFNQLDMIEWSSDLYWAWLYLLQPLLREPGPGCPTFMASANYNLTRMNSALASWTQLRSDKILYTRNVDPKLEMSKLMSKDPAALMPGPARTMPALAYLEPVPEVYARLLALNQMISHELTSMGLLTADWRKRLAGIGQLLATAQQVAEKELEDVPLSANEQENLRALPVRLGEIGGGPMATPTIVTVAEDSTGDWLLQEATGRPDLLIVVVRLPGGKLVTFAGPVMSYYEFKLPRTAALTQEMWLEQLHAAPGPRRPEWSK
jgi:hypothetical protein